MTEPETIKQQSLQIAHELLSIEAVKLSLNPPFVWASGIKSPIYCDNRIIGSKIQTRDLILAIFSDRVMKDFPGADIIAAVAIGGIPMGILIADRLKLPFIYVREKPKEHGLMKQIEGHYHAGSKVVLIEDHISTGKSSIKAVDALRAEGLEVLALASIMTYGFPQAKFEFKNNDLDTYISLCDLDAILETAVSENKISAEEREVILKFRESPHTWYDNYQNLISQ